MSWLALNPSPNQLHQPRYDLFRVEPPCEHHAITIEAARIRRASSNDRTPRHPPAVITVHGPPPTQDRLLNTHASPRSTLNKQRSINVPQGESHDPYSQHESLGARCHHQALTNLGDSEHLAPKPKVRFRTSISIPRGSISVDGNTQQQPIGSRSHTNQHGKSSRSTDLERAAASTAGLSHAALCHSAMILPPLLYQMPQATHDQHILVLQLHIIARRMGLARAMSAKRSASLRICPASLPRLLCPGEP